MCEEFHELAGAEEVPDVQELSIERARTLHSAIERHRDFKVIQLLRHTDGECIVVEVETDGVPSNNPCGIQYRERLVLRVPVSSKRLIEVLALRKDFPTLIHQNQGSPDDPANLCLYFEPAISVQRTWTPQNFLRRIQWWLEQSARGELHPADQPIDHLFFSSKFELVFVSQNGEALSCPDQHHVITRATERPDHGVTFFVEDRKKEEPAPTKLSSTLIELTLPTVVHGVVERDPVTLGELVDTLSARGVDVLSGLQEELRRQVGAEGVDIAEDKPCVIILLHVPLSRKEGGPIEGTSHRAFLISKGALKLGTDIGALITFDGKYFNGSGILGDDTPIEWRSEPIFPMEVLRRNDAPAARQQSGLNDEGPNGVMVGAGSLGGAILSLWGRMGWGRWTVIDNDHVKPHNISRHTGYFQHVGETKVDVAAALQSAIGCGDNEVKPIYGDACEMDDAAIKGALTNADIVVDASTTLEYPRLASANHHVARHISVFVTPDGGSSVLLAEDTGRMIRLRSLEAQYYRAIIQEEWGQHHIDGAIETYWSGVSCRDVSTVMPYTRVLNHASILAEHIIFATAYKNALISVWERNAELGSVTVRQVEVFAERSLSFDGLNLFIDEGAERQLRNLRADNLPNETGGVLLGYYDFNVSAVVVVGGLPAPPDSESSSGSFQRGIEGLAEAVNEATRRTGGVVGYIGEWHSHPPGHSATPSGHDFVQLIHLALGMADDGLPAVQLIVGESDIQIIQGAITP